MGTQDKLTILFTSVGRRVELVQQFRKAADRLGIRLVIVGADISESAPALAFCDQTVIVPRISDSMYVPTLLQICEEFRVDGLIPTIDTDLYLLACQREQFDAIGTAVFISAPEKIALCRDKRLTAKYFRSLGLESPRAADDVERYDGGFPAFIKPVDGSSSIGANKASTMEELRFFASGLRQYVIQPFVSGREYTVDVFCDMEGRAVYITPRVRLAVRAGEVLKTEICHREDIIEEIKRLIEDFKPRGAITVQLIRDEERKVNHYIEINPRFGGGAPLSMKAGADAAEAAMRILLGQRIDYVPGAAKNGAVYSRFDQSVCTGQSFGAPVRAVIFDLDDTLYSEKEYIRSGYRQVAAMLPEIVHAEEKLWNAFLAGKPAIDDVLRREGVYSEAVRDACLCAYRSHMPSVHLYEGMGELLERLRTNNVKIGIITDGRPEGQRAKIQSLNLEKRVDSVLITDELGGVQFRKPNDIAFRVMQARLQVPFESMIYVGDNPGKDFQAPKALGMQWIYFCNRDGLYSNVDSTTGKTVYSVVELKELLNDML